MRRAVMQQALEALQERYVGALRDRAIEALETALAEPEPRNQCGETCERAKLCAICTKGIAEPEQQVKWDASAPVLLNNGRLPQLPDGSIGVGTPTPCKPVELTDAEIDELLPEPDGSAEINPVRVTTEDGWPAVEYEEVHAWSKPLVLATVRAVIAAYEAKQGEQT